MTELILGLSLGFGAGLSPGPLLTLVVTTTLERGLVAGVRVALAPLVTDAPIVGLTVVLVGAIPGAGLRLLGVVGGVVVALMGIRTARSASRIDGEQDVVRPGVDLWRGVVVNLASPHPWIFWMGVGAPVLVAAWRDAPARGLAFLAGFYGLLIGSKVAIAFMVHRAGSRLGRRARARLIVIGGVLLVVGGAVLVAEAVAGRL